MTPSNSAFSEGIEIPRPIRTPVIVAAALLGLPVAELRRIMQLHGSREDVELEKAERVVREAFPAAMFKSKLPRNSAQPME